jgi:hypothetical protein
MDKAALGQVFSQYFCFPLRSFHRLLHTRHHLASGTGPIGQILADVPVGLILITPQEMIEHTCSMQVSTGAVMNRNTL